MSDAFDRWYPESDSLDADWMDGVEPEPRDPRTTMTASETQTMRQLLNRAAPALGDRAIGGVDAASGLRDRRA